MIDSYVSQIFKFSGAGNDFVVLDGRQGGMEPFRQPGRIGELCQEYHTDGLMILTLPDGKHIAEILSEEIPGQVGNDRHIMADTDMPSPYDFVMEFYNPDGSGGMMCGNGGRCIVAFANYLGINPADGRTYHFLAPDGEHTAEILPEGTPVGGHVHPRTWVGGGARWQQVPGGDEVDNGRGRSERSERSSSDGSSLQKWTVRLKMIDVQGITPVKGGLFLNTGTRHYVQFVDRVDSIDMETTAKPLRWDAVFQPEGTNVNFVEVRADGLHVRTFEKGVEGETLACGTGLTACALAAYKAGVPAADQIPGQAGNDGARHGRPGSAISYRLQCRRGDWPQVDFVPGANDTFTNVYLTGPAELVALN